MNSKPDQYAPGVGMFVALVIGGLLGNYFKFPLFLNIDFIFGGVFAMLALQVLGWGRGVVAGALIASYTYVLWNHPYFLLVATLEIAVVGFLFHRRRIGLVLADAVFWVVLGLPMTYLCYHGLLDVPLTNTSLVMSKSAVNGIFNTLLARLIISLLAGRWRNDQLRYRELTYNLLVAFAIVPSLVLLMMSGRSDFETKDRAIREGLRKEGESLSQHLDIWLRNQTKPIVQLATMAAITTPSQMQAPIEQALASNLNYLRVGLINREARTVAYSPLVDEFGQSTLGRDYADRPFIPVLQQSLKPMLSEVVIAKIGVPIPNVIALAPVVTRGEYSGYIAGILSLKQVNEFFEKGAGATGLRYALVDKNSNVFITNIPSQKLMAPRDRSAGELTPLQNGVAQWVPALAKGAPIMERWKSSMYVSESNIGQSGEWTLLLEQPVAPFQKQLSEGYAELLGLLLLILLGALSLAELVSRRGIRSLETLSSMTKALPGRLTKGDDGIEWPRTNVSEIQQLVANFQEMAGSLSAQFKNVKQSNEQLELRVQERTASLYASLNDKEALIKEVHHRVKNNLQVITSLLRLESHRSNVDNTKSVLGDMHARIRAMALLHELLYRSGTFASVDLGAYLKQLATQAFRSLSTTDGAIQLELDLGSVQVGMDQAIPCGLLVNELISNCLKHGFPAGETGTIRIELKPSEWPSQWCLRVSDTGVGLPENFEEKRKNSLGLQLVGDLARQISGALEITRNSDKGVTFTVNFAAIEPAPLIMPD